MMDKRDLPSGVKSFSLARENHSETAIHLLSRTGGTVIWESRYIDANGVLPDSKSFGCQMMWWCLSAKSLLWFIRECFNSDISNVLLEL